MIFRDRGRDKKEKRTVKVNYRARNALDKLLRCGKSGQPEGADRGPGRFAALEIERQIDEIDGDPEAILLTHGHFDRYAGSGCAAEKYHIPIYSMKRSSTCWGSKENLSGLWSKPYVQADKTVKRAMCCIADFEIHVLATPGHGRRCLLLYSGRESTFSGDTLFCRSYGRYDFPTSSGRELVTRSSAC